MTRTPSVEVPRQTPPPAAPPAPPRLGLRENWRQFSLLVAVSAFVGAMVGLERSILPLLATAEFGLSTNSAVLSFIVTFGVVKALTNLVAGRLSDRYGRKRVLVAGWICALPVPIMVILAPTWSWVVAANVLLGINQGLTWSTTIVMKIDLVGPARRGLAMGLNEFAGYLAVAVMALATGELASRFGLRPEPFYLGIVIAAVGLALSVLFVRDTMSHVRAESDGANPSLARATSHFRRAHPALATANHVGLVNNLNDGLAWGVFPLFFAAAGATLREIGVLAFIYPATWGIVQLYTGHLSDRVGRKRLIAGGMLVQGGALVGMVLGAGFGHWLAMGIVLGIGTAMVYPTLLATIGDVAHPSWRGSAVGTYRLWRDSGYAAGAVLAGVLADAFGLRMAIIVIGGVTLAAGVLAAIRLPETRPRSPVGTT